MWEGKCAVIEALSKFVTATETNLACCALQALSKDINMRYITVHEVMVIMYGVNY